jgi:uncharacterized protein YndB with AHSA1/START domain
VEIRVERLMAAPPSRVMRALTEPKELTDWCGVQARADEAIYHLAGSSLILGEIAGEIIERSEHLLRFAWSVKGQRTEVTISLEPFHDGTRVILTHTGLTEHVLGVKWEWECTWTFWLRYLQSWVQRGSIPPLFDDRGTFPEVVELEILLEAPPAKAWRALIEPELRGRWLPEELGPIVDQEEGRSVSFAWPEVPDSRLTFTLEPLDGHRTRVCLHHVGLGFDGVEYHVGWYDYLVGFCLETAEPRVGPNS